MKGNIYMYAMLILLAAIIVAVLLQLLSGIVPHTGREGNVISISQFSFGFDPDHIELKKGETVTLKIKSAGGDHYFAIDQYGINVPVSPGKEVSINLTADKAGEFLYYDPLPGHNESGENGRLVVK